MLPKVKALKDELLSLVSESDRKLNTMNWLFWKAFDLLTEDKKREIIDYYKEHLAQEERHKEWRSYI